MKKILFLIGMFSMILTFGLAIVGCDTGNTSNTSQKKLNLTGYSQKSAGTRSIFALNIASRSVADGVYISSEYRSFPIDNHDGELSVGDRDITVEAILQFEREVPGYNDDPSNFVGYLNNYLTYPSDAKETGNEKVILVFDSRNPSIRYQVGYHHINQNPSTSNLTYFEDLIAQGKPISIFHVDCTWDFEYNVKCWVIQWIAESEGGIPGSYF